MPSLRRGVLLGAMLLLAGMPTRSSPADWPQWGGASGRNSVAEGQVLPPDWSPGSFDRKTGRWDSTTARNIKWVAKLGSQTYGTPVVANGRIFVGTNNSHGYLKRYPVEVDIGCLLCFRERDGQFLWQFSAEKLPTGRVHDWPLQGIASSPLVEGDRAWFVSSRGEVVCVDTQGFYDDEDDGRPEAQDPARLFDVVRDDDPAQDEVARFVEELGRGKLPNGLRARFARAGMPLPAGDITVKAGHDDREQRWTFQAVVNGNDRDFVVLVAGPRLSAFKLVTPADKEEADVVWRFDMMKELGSRQHNLATCCITSWNDTLFVCTGNGVDETHAVISAPRAPSFFAMNKHTAEILWTSNLPGSNIHHGQWSAPAVGVLGGVPQVIFCGGDGWVYSFHAERWDDGKPQLLWKFDTNAKDALLELGGRGTRNEPIAVPVLYDNKVYVTTGQDPEHGDGDGCIWCIDATKKLDGSDVSPHKVLDARGAVIPHRRTLNYRPWGEQEIRLSDLDRGLDREVLEPRLQDYFSRWQPLPGDATVRVLTRGSEWELSGGRGDSEETLYIWKRRRVNQRGALEEVYVAARRTGERLVDNPDSAAVWKYDKVDEDGDGSVDFYEQMHRAIGSVAIHGDLLFCIDFTGLIHCLDAKTGKRHWTCDTLAAGWTTPLIADGRVFVGDEDGDVAIFQLSADPQKAGTVVKANSHSPPATWLAPAKEITMDASIYANPIAANGVLYVTTKQHLFAIAVPSVVKQ